MQEGRRKVAQIAMGSLLSISRYLLFMITLALTAAILGYTRSNGDFGSIGVMVQGVEDLAVSIKGMPLFQQIAAVFLHNMRVVVIILGVSWFPILPVVAVTIMNSIMIGVMIKATAFATGIPPITVVVGLLPHGIFELLAFFLGAAASLRIGMLMPLWINRTVDGRYMRKAATDAAVVF
ncbi:MAG TPA: stage II sporulation protein M, partial [Bacillota bacterium]|nr:stage II sporulation protein M [Bacillota bacterium]